jgi:hypothetical protein
VCGTDFSLAGLGAGAVQTSALPRTAEDQRALARERALVNRVADSVRTRHVEHLRYAAH